MNVHELELDVRTKRLLVDAGLDTMADIEAALMKDGDEALLKVDGIGPKTVEDVKTAIDWYGANDGAIDIAEAELFAEDATDPEALDPVAIPEPMTEGGFGIVENPIDPVGEIIATAELSAKPPLSEPPHRRCINCGQDEYPVELVDDPEVDYWQFYCPACGHVWTMAEETAPFRRMQRGENAVIRRSE